MAASRRSVPEPDLPPVPPGPDGRRAITPTDVAQFIRLDQCERYLRLALHTRATNSGFLNRYGVAFQRIPPLLSRSGSEFETAVESAVRRRFEVFNFQTDAPRFDPDKTDSEDVLRIIRELQPGATRVLFQARLAATSGDWRLRGDADILRLERDAAGRLCVLIADMKSSTASKLEHRLQVAFYVEMLAELLAADGVDDVTIDMGVLYRGERHVDPDSDPDEAERREEQRAAAVRLFGFEDGFLEIVDDPQTYRDAVGTLVVGPHSTAERVAEMPFEEVGFHLNVRCDGCFFNEFCMKWIAEHDDLSLTPHLSRLDKDALRRAGVTTMSQLAGLREPVENGTRHQLGPAPGQEQLNRALAVTWPLGPRLDELVHRAQRYRRSQGDPYDAPARIPSKGYPSLPHTDPEHNPNLVTVYVDGQHDHLYDRIYLLGALVVAHEAGEPVRRRSVVRLADGPPETAAREEQLFVAWIDDVVRTVVELAASDANGERNAPLHLVFFNSYEQRKLLEGLARHFKAVVGATPMYDFITQLAAYDSPLATFLDVEMREFKNYPRVCQSLQSIAALLRFNWNEPEPFRQIFRARLFDDQRRIDDVEERAQWYTARSRFASQIPLEYAYAAWGELPAPAARGRDDYRPFRRATSRLLRAFEARRLDAMEHIAGDFDGNRDTSKTPFALPELTSFEDKADTLAQALDEFVTIERHVELAAWKQARLAQPERRVLNGVTLLARYREQDQDVEIVALNRENQLRHQLREAYRAAWRAEHPDAKQVRLPPEQREASAWSQENMLVRLQLVADGLECSLDEALALTTIRENDQLVIFPRWTVDSRKLLEEQTPLTPTPKQLLYGGRVALRRLLVNRDADGKVQAAWAEVALQDMRGSGAPRGFAFPSSRTEPLTADELYTLDPDPNSWYGSWTAKVSEGLCAGEPNALYERLAGVDPVLVHWPASASEAQATFLAGLDAFAGKRALHAFEPSKRAYIGGYGDAPTLLVQGPPGTGKSYGTAYALLARLQGALASGQPFRAIVSCKTHAATDVLLENVLRVQRTLLRLSEWHPALFAEFFDHRILTTPLFRIEPRGHPPEGILPMRRKREKGEPQLSDQFQAHEHCIVGAAPGGVYRLVSDSWKEFFGHELCDCLVLDEASQMSLPEAIMAALPLKPEGQLIVVGDHRQMPPIIKHRWEHEQRRTFKEFRSYESLFEALLALRPPMIKFEESFRLHADMAEFLRQEIYRHDQIPFFSNARTVLPAVAQADAFVAAVLTPEHPLVVVAHDEDQSQQRNIFEQRLIEPVLRALGDERSFGFDPLSGLGVVVPHRAQRAALQDALPMLVVTDPETGTIRRSAVDTVERFQGDERLVIIVSATESDRNYLLQAGEFLLDPRRLTVALSRAKQKVVLVASRSVFNLFSADEEVFASAQLWKNLLRRTCTVELWSGERDGQRVEVWGNRSTVVSAQPPTEVSH